MNNVKSKQRVADHGEVFTPAWMAEAMLDLVKDFHLLVRFQGVQHRADEPGRVRISALRRCVTPLHRHR